MSLPWDRFQPDPVAPVSTPDPVPVPPSTLPPVAPVPPVQNLPATTDIDLGQILKEAFLQSMTENAKNFGREAFDAIKHGQAIDITHPTITAETAAGKELVIADAKSRSWRTFLQGLVIDLAAALVVILGTITSIDPPLDKAAWIAVGAMAVKTLIQAGLSYIMRIRITPTIRTPGDKVELVSVPMPIPNERNAA